MSVGARKSGVEQPSLAEVRGRAVISVPEAGALLGLGRAASYVAVKNGEIPSIAIGRRKIVPVARLLEMLGESPLDR